MKKHRLEVYRTKSRGPGRPSEFRWRIWCRGRKVANGGESYRRRGSLLSTLRSLFVGTPIIRQIDAIAQK
jgi:hypothetical protein